MALLEAKFVMLIFCSLMMFRSFKPSLYLDLKTITIENGEIMGEEHNSYVAFKGIPYAEAERFSLPKPLSRHWNDIKKFDKFGDQCAQYDHLSYTFEGSEKCLNLNVYVPKRVLKSNELVPVILFIHGGAFMFGASDYYGADMIMESQGLILVTINYRLGILGFLSTEDEVIPGNLGMKDQVEALRWVQRNIRAFSGDPSRVTITGYSAGGASVHLHMLSPLSSDLFKNGISHSGDALNPWVMMESAKEKAFEVGNLVNCKNIKSDSKKLLKCLMKIPTEKLVTAVKNFQPFLYNPFSPFGVVVEKNNDHPFIADHPLKIIQSKNYKKRPWIASVTRDEGLYPGAEFYKNETVKKIDKDWETLAPFILDYNATTNDDALKLEWSKKIRKFYFGDEKIEIKNFQKLTKLLSDRLFKDGFYNTLSLQSEYSPSSCYYFTFQADKSTVNEILKESPDNLGVAHGDDLFLIYNNHQLSEYTNDESTIASDFIEMYRVFAQSSDAVYANQRIKPIKKSSSFECLEISAAVGNKMIPIDRSFGEIDFWRSLNIHE